MGDTFVEPRPPLKSNLINPHHHKQIIINAEKDIHTCATTVLSRSQIGTAGIRRVDYIANSIPQKK